MTSNGSQAGERPRPKRKRPSPRTVLRGHTSAVTALTFLRDSTHILSGDENGKLRLWDTALEETVLLHTTPCSTGERGKNAIQTILQRATKEDAVVVHRKNGDVHRMSLTHDARGFDTDAWTCGDAGGVRKGFVSEGFCKACFVDGDTWVAAGADGTEVVVVDERTHTSVGGGMRRGRRGGMVMCVSRVSETDVFCGYEDGSVATWDTRMREMRNEADVADDAVLGAAVSPRGHVAAVGGGFGEVLAVADIETRDVGVVERGRMGVCGVGDVAWRGDGRFVVSGGWDGTVRVWDGRRRRGALMRRVCELLGHEGSVRCVGYSADGRLLASGGSDRSVVVWDGDL